MPRDTITRAQYEAAYQAGLALYDDPSLGIHEATLRLAKTDIEGSTGVSLIYNVSRLLRGEVYKRTMSSAVTDDYLTWIRRDRGDAAWKNARAALSKHIDYYESKIGGRPGLRKILGRHEAHQSHSAESVILLNWPDYHSRNFADVLPLSLFSTTGMRKGIVHAVRHKNGGVYSAKCDVTVRQQEADLDYAAHRAFNLRHEMLLGITRLKFSDTDRTDVEAAQWKSANATTFEDCAKALVILSAPPSTPYKPPTASAAKRLQMIRERPGQIKFRRDLKAAYEQRCCISGCGVSEALEGAHIDAYIAPGSDSLQNGLLLRRDIHALFDRDLIAIEPATLIVRVAKPARGQMDYFSFHGTKLRLPKDPSHYPDRGAIERRWARFIEASSKKGKADAEM
jgi:hypothetical protein